MLVVWIFKNITWEHDEFDEGKSPPSFNVATF